MHTICINIVSKADGTVAPLPSIGVALIWIELNLFGRNCPVLCAETSCNSQPPPSPSPTPPPPSSNVLPTHLNLTCHIAPRNMHIRTHMRTHRLQSLDPCQLVILFAFSCRPCVLYPEKSRPYRRYVYSRGGFFYRLLSHYNTIFFPPRMLAFCRQVCNVCPSGCGFSRIRSPQHICRLFSSTLSHCVPAGEEAPQSGRIWCYVKHCDEFVHVGCNGMWGEQWNVSRRDIMWCGWMRSTWRVRSFYCACRICSFQCWSVRVVPVGWSEKITSEWMNWDVRKTHNISKQTPVELVGDVVSLPAVSLSLTLWPEIVCGRSSGSVAFFSMWKNISCGSRTFHVVELCCMNVMNKVLVGYYHQICYGHLRFYKCVILLTWFTY